MNWDQIKGQWHQLKGQVKSKWGKLTDDDITNISGKKEQLIGRLQQRYGIMKDQAEKQVDEWLARLPPPRDS
ncbi:MAG TPA: CsbD family protein [Polyangiaceae bacterium]|nr:CsbD family protein [Polyangiaceae bacterium]